MMQTIRSAPSRLGAHATPHGQSVARSSRCGPRPHIRHASFMSAWKINDSLDNRLDVQVKDKLRCTQVRLPTISSASEILVKVHATSINPLDVRMCYGYGRRVLDLLDMVTNPEVRVTNDRYPLTLGRDFSGEVVAVGPGLTHRYKPGDLVCGAVEPQRSGAHAEYVTATAGCVTRKPDNLSHQEAASIPFVALTAHSALSCFGGLNQKNANGKSVLVLGGSGGVGAFAIQLLKVWGASVTATCSAEKIDYLESTLFVERAVDYQDPSQMGSLAGRFDFVLDCGDYEQTVKQHQDIVADGTRYLRPMSRAVYVTLSPPILKNTDRQGLVLGGARTVLEMVHDTLTDLKNLNSARWAIFLPNKSALDYISGLYEEQAIRPQIHSVHPFGGLAGAYAELQAGLARGKVIVDVTTSKSDKADEGSRTSCESQ